MLKHCVGNCTVNLLSSIRLTVLTVCSVSAVKKEKEDVESKVEAKQDAPPDPPQEPPPDPPLDPPASSEDSEKTEKEDKKASPLVPPVRESGSKPLPSRAKKTMPGSPRLAVLRQLQTEPPQVSRNSRSGAEKLQNTPVASTSVAPEIRVLPVALAPVPPPRPLQAHPNMQMRQNIRRSLTDTLLKRLEHLQAPPTNRALCSYCCQAIQKDFIDPFQPI